MYTKKMMIVTGSVLRILAVKRVTRDAAETCDADLILADERQYWRVSLWDEQIDLITSGAIQTGDTIRIENAVPARAGAGGARRLNAGSSARITRLKTQIEPLRDAPATKLTVLAVARPERGKVCVAGVDAHGSWLRPQYVYEFELFSAARPLFSNLCVSSIYLDAWRGRHARIEDRFFVYSRGVETELPAEERRRFLERHLDGSVDEVFKSGRSLGLIKPRIMQVYEERAPGKAREQHYEQYIRFNFKDRSGRLYRHWSCRCAAFYKAWNSIKQKHRWTCGWRVLRQLQRNDTYLAIGLTYSDYGVERLEYGAYPLIVGVHIVPHS